MVLNGKKVLGWVVALAILAGGAYWFLGDDSPQALPVAGNAGAVKEFDLLAVEHTGTHPQTGEKVEIYRWDPGFLVVNKGDRVRLNITGLHGEHHPFEIEGLNVTGHVSKGETTTVEFIANETGTFRLICHNHTDWDHAGPMVGHIVVID